MRKQFLTLLEMAAGRQRPGYFLLFYIYTPISLAAGIGFMIYVLVVPDSPLHIPMLMAVPFLLLTPLLVIISVFVALRHASAIMLGWFDADEDRAFELILGHMFSGSPPLIHGADGTIRMDEGLKALAKLGTPMARTLTLDVYTAVATEMGGKPYQTYFSPGQHLLMPFEEIRATLDLRDRIAKATTIKVFTRDGVELALRVGASFHIRRDFDDRPFHEVIQTPPFVNGDTIYKAVYQRPVLEAGGKLMDVDKVVLGVVQGQVKKIFSQHYFSNFFPSAPEAQEVGIDEFSSLDKVSQQVVESVASIVENWWLSITFVNIEWDFEAVNEALDVTREYWKRTRDTAVEKAISNYTADIRSDRLDKVIEVLREKGYRGDNLSHLRSMMNDALALLYTVDRIVSEDDTGAPYLSWSRNRIYGDMDTPPLRDLERMQRRQQRIRDAQNEPGYQDLMEPGVTEGEADFMGLDEMLADKFKDARSE